MLRKLGFSGDGQFQAKLRDELCEMISGPVAKRNVWKERLSEGHFLNHHSRQALEDQLRTMDQVDQDDFDALCRLRSAFGLGHGCVPPALDRMRDCLGAGNAVGVRQDANGRS